MRSSFQTSDLISRFPLPVFLLWKVLELLWKVLEFQAKLNFSKSCCTTSIDKSCYIPCLTTDQQVIRPITEAPFETYPKKKHPVSVSIYLREVYWP